MRCLLNTLALVLLLVPFVGCRSQTTAMTNPFMSPDRVPPPATRTLLPGTAQPYYPGDPVPNTPVIGQPPTGFAPGATTQPSFSPTPQPAGVVPPGGWNTQPQTIPGGPVSLNVMPNNLQASNGVVQVQPDQQNLRFAPTTPAFQAAPVAPAFAQNLPPDPSVLPTPQIQQVVSPYPNQLVNYEVPNSQQPFVQQVEPAGAQREVRIRAISSDNLSPNGGARDGFRPQGSSQSRSNQVRKPTLISRLAPRQPRPAQQAIDRFGFDPDYQWLRGRLGYSQLGQWTLQYATDREASDPLGGNIPIANPQVLGDLQPGDFVQLRGQLDQSQNAGPPTYRVSVVQRQRI